MNKNKFIFGVLLTIVALYGGSYLVYITYKTWLGFPVIVTAFLAFLTGLILVENSFHKKVT